MEADMAVLTDREQGVACLGLTADQLDGLLAMARLCRGDRHPLDSFLDTLLGVRYEVDGA